MQIQSSVSGDLNTLPPSQTPYYVLVYSVKDVKNLVYVKSSLVGTKSKLSLYGDTTFAGCKAFATSQQLVGFPSRDPGAVNE